MIYNIILATKELKSNFCTYVYVVLKTLHSTKSKVITMKENLRDKTRDNLNQDLNFIGVPADLAERGHVRESVENSWYQRSLGVINVEESSIPWINILKQDGGKNNPPRWWMVFGIPDDRSSEIHPHTKIKTIRKKSFPLFGKIKDVTWKGEDDGLGLINELSMDLEIKTLAMKVGNLEIKRQTGAFQGWTLVLDRKFHPSNEDWNTIEKIADYVLSSQRFRNRK